MNVAQAYFFNSAAYLTESEQEALVQAFTLDADGLDAAVNALATASAERHGIHPVLARTMVLRAADQMYARGQIQL